ncbi:MAG: transcription antitermination factor NusB [Candidatus Omnitrophota bacterium]|nr:transcription antitermination factor NusB [Candidatus Omnitrophota bacterium]
MRKRTKAREYALQVLYQVDIRRGDAAELLKEFWGAHQLDPDVRIFAQQLAEGTLAHASEIDQLITVHASNWDLKRMAVVDRNILRLGVFELRYEEDVPPTVCINEAIELAKRFGDEESAKFINGILDAVYKSSAKKHAPTDSPAATN